MGFTVERNGYTDMVKLTNDLLLDLTGNGFTTVHPTTGITAQTVEATLEATNTVDPLVGGATPPEQQQPWRIKIKWVPEYLSLKVWVACAEQLDDLGGISAYSKYWDSGDLSHDPTLDPIHYPPHLDDEKPTSSYEFRDSAIPPFFMHRTYEDLKLIGGTGDNRNDLRYTDSWLDPNAHTLSYRLSISDHGVAFMVWDESRVQGSRYFNWFVVQRPVNAQTGAPLVTGKAPLFCVYSIGGTPERTFRFTVREQDIYCPDAPSTVVSHNTDVNAIMNGSTQVSITESDNYVLTFPNGVNTRRYMYTEELDMIAFTSADVISQWADVPITVYGEGTPRNYKAMHSNGNYNTGMRLLMLTEGGGV